MDQIQLHSFNEQYKNHKSDGRIHILLHIRFGLQEGHCPQHSGFVQSGQAHAGRHPSHAGQIVPSSQISIGSSMGLTILNAETAADVPPFFRIKVKD